MTATGSSDLHALAFTCCADPLLLLDPEGLILEVNPAAERLLARPAAEARGHAIDEALQPDPRATPTPASPFAHLLAEARQARTARALPQGTTLRLGPDRALSVEGSLSPLLDAEGMCMGALLLLRDVTEQRRAEQRLRARAALVEEVLDKLDAGVAVYDAEERLVLLNPKCAELYPQITAFTTVGKTIEEIARAFCRLGGHLKSGLSEDEWIAQRLAEHRRGAASGLQQIGDRWIRIDDRRTADGSVISLRTDVTALKEAELALQRERQFSQLVLDTNPNLIFVKDQEGRLLLFNKAYATMLNTSLDKLRGYTSGDVFRRASERARITETDHEMLRTLKTVSHEAPFTLPSGEVRWFNTTKVPLIEPDGTAHILGIAVDITERKAQEEARARTISELERQRQEIADKLALIGSQRALIEALSTPVLKVAEGVVAIPVIGAMDAARAGEITTKLLDEIARTRARFAILDVTGMPTVDAEMAGHFVRMVSSIRLLGAQGVLTGIAPAVARSLCGLGVDLGGITTRATLRDALEMCMRAVEGEPRLAETQRAR